MNKGQPTLGTADQQFGSHTQAEIAEANRRVYERLSCDYESQVITSDSNRRLRALLVNAVSCLARQGIREIRALDACGGTGNAAVELLDLGCDVTLVDVSREMTTIFRDRLEGGERARSIVGDVADFLQESHEPWDLIVFSSALHHLSNPGNTVLLALSRLSEGGLLVTVADPTEKVRSRAFRAISLLDRIVFGLRKRPLKTLSTIWDKLSHSSGAGSEPAIADGRLAEYHARTGIDDQAILRKLEGSGYHALHHQNYSGGYNVAVQQLYRTLRMRTSFSMVVSNRRQEFGVSEE